MPDESNHHPTGPNAAHEQFLTLFLRSEREIVRYVSALVPSLSDVDDIVQQTAISLWEKFDTYDPARPFPPWACRFALNKTRQWIGRRQRWKALLANGLAEELEQRRGELQPAWETRLRSLDGCLAQHPEEQRSLVEGYYFRRDGVETLATDAGRSVAATYKMLQRIRHSLQRCIEGSASPGGGGDMNIVYPSREFDDTVAAACHGSLSEEQAKAMNLLLQSDAHARDEYLLRVEIHARLGSDPNLFDATQEPPERTLTMPSRKRVPVWGILAAAASLALVAILWWGRQSEPPVEVAETTTPDAQPCRGCRVDGRQQDPCCGSLVGAGMVAAVSFVKAK